MSRFIELINFTNISSGDKTMDEIIDYQVLCRRDAAAVCDYNSLQAWPRMCRRCQNSGNISPVYGMLVRVRAPEKCMLEFVELYCYVRSEMGIDALYRIFNKIKDDAVDLPVLLANAKELYIGINICTRYAPMILPHIIDTVIRPDFVFINHELQNDDNCGRILDYLHRNKIMICATTRSVCLPGAQMAGCGMFNDTEAVSDTELRVKFDFLGELAEQIVFENPRCIAGFDVVDDDGTGEQMFSNYMDYYDIIPPYREFVGYDCTEGLLARCDERIKELFGSSGEFVAIDRYRSERAFIGNFGDAAIGFLMAATIADYCRENGLKAVGRGVFERSFAAWLLGIIDECPIDPSVHCELFSGELDFCMEVPAQLWSQLSEILNERLSDYRFINGGVIMYEEAESDFPQAEYKLGYYKKTGDHMMMDVLVCGPIDEEMPVANSGFLAYTHFDYREYSPAVRMNIKYTQKTDSDE